MKTALMVSAALALTAARPALADSVESVSGLTTPDAEAIECLTAAIYYEAGNEPVEGRQAVAEVVLNRMADPRYPKTVCGVVYQGSRRATGCQFTFTCDGSLARPRAARGWEEARLLAEAALTSGPTAHVGGATHYHADYVKPVWASALAEVRTIGRHIFYSGRRIARAVTAPSGASSAAAAPAVFAPWGVPVARLGQAAGGVTVSPAGP